MNDLGFRPDELLSAAIRAREQSYAPYSQFRVGAALLCSDGTVYTGCNIENASYTPTVCAERVALFKAVSEGKRDFVAVAIVGGKGDALSEICPPCGVCRQALCEFCDAKMPVVLGTPGAIRTVTLGDLLPFAFTGRDL